MATPAGPTLSFLRNEYLVTTGGQSVSYIYEKAPRAFEDFRAACDSLQTSPDSRFTRGDLVTLATPSGRTTLAGDRLIVNEGARREERALESSEDRRRVLHEHFRLALEMS